MVQIIAVQSIQVVRTRTTLNERGPTELSQYIHSTYHKKTVLNVQKTPEDTWRSARLIV